MPHITEQAGNLSYGGTLPDFLSCYRHLKLILLPGHPTLIDGSPPHLINRQQECGVAQKRGKERGLHLPNTAVLVLALLAMILGYLLLMREPTYRMLRYGELVQVLETARHNPAGDSPKSLCGPIRHPR